MSANFTGKARILKEVNSYDHISRIVIRDKSRDIKIFTGSQDKIVAELSEWMDLTQAEGGNEFKQFSLKIFCKGEKTKSDGVAIVEFTFALEQFQPFGQRHQMAGIDSGIIQVYNELAQTKAELMVANERIEDLEAELDEIEDEFENYKKTHTEGSGDIFGQVRQFLTMLPGFPGSSQAPPTSQVVNGPPANDEAAIIQELKTLDADFIANLAMILELRKKAPEVYFGTIAQLKAYLQGAVQQ